MTQDSYKKQHHKTVPIAPCQVEPNQDVLTTVALTMEQLTMSMMMTPMLLLLHVEHLLLQ
jgi:hypothetical protein